MRQSFVVSLQVKPSSPHSLSRADSVPNDRREQRSFLFCWRSCRRSTVFSFPVTHLSILIIQWLCFEWLTYAANDFVLDSAGFDSQRLSCVCTSAFLHVFYVFIKFVVSSVCMYAHMCVCYFYMFSVCAWMRLCMSVFIVQNNDVFLYEEWAVKKSYSEIQSVVAD